MFNTLRKIQENNQLSYYITNKINFYPKNINDKYINTALNFSYKMAFSDGHHRNHRTGGSLQRKNGEIFCNTFQGKISEIVFKYYIENNNISGSDIDLDVYGINQWDDCDYIIKDKKISIKSAAFFSNLLLLEEKDWDQNGEYIPNFGKNKNRNYDYFVLIRIKPDIKTIFRQKKLLYNNQIEYSIIQDLISEQEWFFDIPGYITGNDLKKIIKEPFIIPKNSLLNGKTKIDANNYYIQTGNLKKIDLLITELLQL